jgi:hypothetical protein
LNSSKSFLFAGLNSLRGLNERRNVDRFRFIIEGPKPCYLLTDSR